MPCQPKSQARKARMQAITASPRIRPRKNGRARRRRYWRRRRRGLWRPGLPDGRQEPVLPRGQASLASYSSRSLFQQLAGGMSGGRPGNYSEIGITGLGPRAAEAQEATIRLTSLQMATMRKASCCCCIDFVGPGRSERQAVERRKQMARGIVSSTASGCQADLIPAVRV